VITPLPIAFCENGAGYGGAIISLTAMLDHLEPRYAPVLLTGLATEPYRALARFGRWRHLAARELVDHRALRRRRVPFTSMIDNLFNVLPNALRYYNAFRAEGIRVVYLNNDASCNFAAAVGARLAGLPLVLHARGFHADTSVNRLVLKWLDHCIPVSNAVKTELLRLGLPEDKCTVIPEGLDLDLFRPSLAQPALRAELGLEPDDPVITLVGGLIDWKGQDILLAAAPHLFERYPRLRILLVGSAYGRDDLFARQIAEQVAAPAMAGRVLLLGGRSDVADILAISSVVVHASTKPEPFGRTFLEGMAAGRPVIAAAEGGPLDVITHEHDGLLVTPRDPRLLAQAILQILDHPERAAEMARNATQTARRYSIEQHTAAVSAILLRLTAGMKP
jgi:glycosyltransferase involved in cell wall biosynthesis